ncbi:MAG: hypothetical protein NC321_02225 [Clostridium sp.]|nr:hypothetical protein [Clostridium sp.]
MRVTASKARLIAMRLLSLFLERAIRNALLKSLNRPAEIKIGMQISRIIKKLGKSIK